MIFTVYDNKINLNVVGLQKRVFDIYGVEINQVRIDNWVSHGKSVDDILSGLTDPNEVVVLFDIDSIPLNPDIVPKSIKWCEENVGIISVAQRAVRLKNPIIHGGPSFMVFSIDTFNKLGRPSFETNQRSDCGAEMTYEARKRGVEVRLMYPTTVEREDYILDGNVKFGMGTNYENNIYHAFESRFDNKNHYFIDKCEDIIKNNG
jgi:hypothetical protein